MPEPQFRHLCTYNAIIEFPQQNVGEGPYGRRQIGKVLGGEVSGERLHGKVLEGGADWALVKGDALRLDARLTMESHDGAQIYVSYRGIIKPYVAGLRDLLDSGELPLEDFYYRTTPAFETGDPRYEWVNDLVCVAMGGLDDQGVNYEVYEIL